MQIIKKLISPPPPPILILSTIILLSTCGDDDPGGGGGAPKSPPVLVQFAVGNDTVCALLSDNTLLCWGNNVYGQLGNKSFGNGRYIPTVITTIKETKVKTVKIGNSHTCVISDDGSVLCWGWNDSYQSGPDTGDVCSNSSCALTPTEPDLGNGNSAKAISLGAGFSCVILDDDSLKCWGARANGKLGIGSPSDDVLTPTTVNLGAGKKAKSISTGAQHACAILDDNTLKCWGLNQRGQLGYGDTSTRKAPETTTTVNLGQDRTAKAVSTGNEHTCAILDDDSVKCWGLNNLGQLGYGDTNNREAPETTTTVNLGQDKTAKAINTGTHHTCALFWMTTPSNAGGPTATASWEGETVSPMRRAMTLA